MHQDGVKNTTLLNTKTLESKKILPTSVQHGISSLHQKNQMK